MRIGLLLVNLGSPESTDPKDVKKYLHQFLNDPYVIDLPKFFRDLLVNGIILRTRPKKSARAYSKIWTKDGSPLVFHTRCLAEKVRKRFPVPVAYGMRYGEPSIEAGVKSLIHQGVKHVVLLPLYPQYSYAASETAIVEFKRVLETYQGRIEHSIIEDFHDHPAFIRSWSLPLSKAWREMQPDLLLLSYHGVPKRQCSKTSNGKDYREHCLRTTELLKQAMGLNDEQVITAFQSRLGPVKWIEPYTDLVLKELPLKGVKRLLIASPSFTADCLETLEEIDMRYRQDFLHAGGSEFRYVPCPNSDEPFVEAVQEIALPFCLPPFSPASQSPFGKSL